MCHLLSVLIDHLHRAIMSPLHPHFCKAVEQQAFLQFLLYDKSVPNYPFLPSVTVMLPLFLHIT